MINPKSSDASIVRGEAWLDSFGSAEIAKGKKNVSSPAIDTIRSVAF